MGGGGGGSSPPSPPSSVRCSMIVKRGGEGVRRRRNILLVGRSAAISLVYSLLESGRPDNIFISSSSYLPASGATVHFRVRWAVCFSAGGGEKLRAYFWAYEGKRKRERNTHNERRDRNGAYLKTCSLF